MVSYFQNMMGWMPLTRDYTPYFILGSIIFFLAFIHLFDIANLPKCLNHMADACKMLNDMPRVERGHRYCIGATNIPELSFYIYI